MRNIATDWWHRLGSENWIRCPVPNCTATLPLRYNIDLTNMLRSLGDGQVLAHVQQFDRANSLRAALEATGGSTGSLPTREACRVAEALHSRLVRHEVMHQLFDVRVAYGPAVQMLPIDSSDGRRTLNVPIFTSLFRRKAVPRECTVCAEGIADVDVRDEEVWNAVCRPFVGEWSWKVRAFPTKSLLPTCAARHSLDICRGCLARHLSSRLDTLGRASVDALHCPTPDCNHTYTDTELKALASPTTFARYDKLRLLAHLAALPNFRWCLREGCDGGQIYDTEPDGSTLIWTDVNTPPTRNRIACGACGFAMCFAHQTPWHEAVSCAAYDSERRPEYAATTAWLAGNTKKCPGPGCSVFVEKKGGCFHMTCRECRFEFCWECLADWKRICRGGTYNRKEHREGCYFRGATARMPTHVMGDTIEAATGAAL
jgi:hypothetical protein